jgi:hypothetical protein
MDPQTQARIAVLRQKSLSGDITLEELREGIRLMRDGRVAAQATSTASRAKKAPVNVDDLLAGLEGIGP